MTSPARTDAPDVELVRRAGAGDRDAFAAIYERYHRAVYRFARMMSGSSVMAEDVTQETFIVLMRDVARFQPERAGLSTYLYGVVRNLTRHRMRRERRFVDFTCLETVGTEPTSNDDPAGDFARVETVRRVRKIIALLPSRYREVVILCELHGLSYREVASVINIPVGTVRSRLHRARKLIAEHIACGDTVAVSMTNITASCPA